MKLRVVENFLKMSSLLILILLTQSVYFESASASKKFYGVRKNIYSWIQSANRNLLISIWMLKKNKFEYLGIFYLLLLENTCNQLCLGKKIITCKNLWNDN